MSSTDFVPNVEQLGQSVLMLQALRDPTRPDHQMAVKSIETHLLDPHFILNMLHVFSRGALYESMGLTVDLRQLAGLIIKNYVFPNLQKLPVHVQQALKKEVVNVLSDVNSDIRKTAAILAGKISESFPVAVWCDMLGPVFQMLDVSLYTLHPTAVDGSLQAVQRICEDSCLKLSLDEVNRPLEVLIPKLIALLACSEASIRIRALESYNSLLYLLDVDGVGRRDSFEEVYEEYDNSPGKSNRSNGGGVSASFRNGSHPLVLHMNIFIQAIAALSGDANAEVRRCVCQAITIIASMHVAALDPYFSSIAQFMLTAMLDREETVAIESCEFWTVLLQSADTKRAMLPYLRGVVENLIGRLYLSAEQMEQERVDEEEESSGEKELNLRPMHHRAAGSSDDAAKEESELSARWTLRKQAALTLDNVALSFPPADILSFALPKIQESFQSGDVLVRESGMLALGALSSGCLDDMADYIPQLFPFLIQNMLDSLPEMRSISCWVLSRYCALFEEHNGESLGGGYYEQTLQALLATMFDVKPKVQVAACSALCIVIENSFYAPQSTAPDAPEVNLVSLFIPAILQAVNKAFLVYGVKSSLILIDSIGTLADTVGTDLRNPAYTALYLPQLVAKYNELDDFDMRMFPVLECFTSLLSVLGLEAQSYVQHIYQRSLRMLQVVMKPVAGGEDEDFEAPVKDFAICALDVISALSEGLGDLFPTLVAGSRDVLLEGMLLTMNDDLADLRQSGFSLSGEVCKNSFSLLTAEVAGHVLDLAVRNLDVDFPLVCNNAAWTVGELALQAKGDFMRPYVPRVMQALIVALQQPDGVLEDNLKINIAVTIGRLGIVNTAEVALLADEFFADWCSMLTLTCPLGEKTQAFQGLLAVLNSSPSIVLGNKTNIFSFVTACCAAWVDESEPPLDVMTGLREVLVAVRGHNTVLWGKVMSKFESGQVQVLGQMFGL